MSSFSSVVLYRPETSFVLDLQSYNGNTEAILALYKTWLGEKLGEKLLAFLSVENMRIVNTLCISKEKAAHYNVDLIVKFFEENSKITQRILNAN